MGQLAESGDRDLEADRDQSGAKWSCPTLLSREGEYFIYSEYLL